MEANNRPISTQQVHRHTEVQDGDTSNRSSSCIQGSMDDFNRPNRRLLSRSDCLQPQEVLKVRLPGRELPIYVSLLRSLYSSTGVHQGHEASSTYRPQGRDTSTSVPGRLASSGKDRRRVDQAHSKSTGDNQTTRTKSQHREVGSHTQYIDHLSRDGDRFDRLQSVSYPEKDRRSSKPDLALPGERSTTSMEVAATNGSSSLNGETSTSGQKKTKTATIPTQRELEISSGSEQAGLHHTGMSASGSMVVSSRKTSGRSITGTFHFKLPDLHRRVKGRLGSMHSRSSEIRSMDKGGVPSTHKCSRTRSSSKGIESIPTISGGFYSCCNVRQHDSGIVPQQTGGDTFQDPVLEHHSSSRLGRRSSDHNKINLCTRSTQCNSGRSQSQESNTKAGMVPSSSSIQANMQGMGDTNDRSLRDEPQSQAASLLFSSSRRSSTGIRCNDTQLGRNDSIRLPSYQPHKSNSEQDYTGQSRSHSDSSSLGKSSLVPGPSTASGSRTISTTPVEEASETITSITVSQPTGNTQPTRLEIIKQHLQKKGFSQQASETISGHHRESTSKLYQFKWALFADWCNRREIDPLKASIPTVADFFLYLFHEKNLKMSTIKGYRSAIARVLRYQGMDISNDEEISMLMRSLDIKRPTTMSTVPKWDLALVLRHLTKPPYEPLHLASLKLLTFKAIFLLSLASAKRIGELHALTKNFSHTNNWNSITIMFDPSFLAKTQDPADPSTGLSSLTIPALANEVASDLPDRLLCPVRAIRYYIKRTEPLRGNRSRLFLPIMAGNTKDISKVTISNWVKEVIKSAHESATDTDANLIRVSTHELRALATSILFKHTHSLNAVMEAACWRNHNTFSHFYLRDITKTNDDIMSLGPIVAGQGIVGEAMTNPNQ